MNKTIIKVPSEVNFISDWTGFSELIPPGHVIINKKYPGCGLTTWVLSNEIPTVLCVPRKYLGENKVEQMGQYGQQCYYFQPSIKANATKQREENERKFNELRRYINWTSPFSAVPHVPKIIVTYDSLPTIYGVLEESKVPFVYVVDEHQSCFQDYGFKAEVIERVSSLLRSLSNVWYVSATPILEKYLDRMEYLQDLPYLELEWPADKIIDVEVRYLPMSSTREQLSKIIAEYKHTGIFDRMEHDGEIASSTEAVFFVNSVTDIARTIRDNALSPDEVNILVAHDSNNKKTLEKYAGPGFRFGKIPTEGKRHATYTFCSKCVYYGVDFYSPSASTYIFADANISAMSTDLTLDFLQIIGRQRLASNVFRHRCHIFVKTTKTEIQPEPEFQATQQAKWLESAKLCDQYNRLDQKALGAITNIDKEAAPYAVIFKDAVTGKYQAKNCVNALISEQHAWEMRNKIYRDHETVQSLVVEGGFRLANRVSIPDGLRLFAESLPAVPTESDRLACYAAFFDANPSWLQFVPTLVSLPSDYYKYYTTLGTAVLDQCGYDLNAVGKVYKESRMRTLLGPDIPCFRHALPKSELTHLSTKSYSSCCS